METFTWLSTHAEMSEEPRVLAAKFGDGYEQRAEDGINTMLQVWDLKFERMQPEVGKAIRDFLKARKGVEAFYWTTKFGETKKFTCRKWKPADDDKRTMTITATFNEVVA